MRIYVWNWISESRPFKINVLEWEPEGFHKSKELPNTWILHLYPARLGGIFAEEHPFHTYE
jgi:hypothetical protein